MFSILIYSSYLLFSFHLLVHIALPMALATRRWKSSLLWLKYGQHLDVRWYEQCPEITLHMSCCKASSVKVYMCWKDIIHFSYLKLELEDLILPDVCLYHLPFRLKLSDVYHFVSLLWLPNWTSFTFLVSSSSYRISPRARLWTVKTELHSRMVFIPSSCLAEKLIHTISWCLKLIPPSLLYGRLVINFPDKPVLFSPFLSWTLPGACHQVWSQSVSLGIWMGCHPVRGSLHPELE